MPRLARMSKKEPEKPKHSSIKTSTLVAMSVALAFASLGLMVTSATVTPRHVLSSFIETTRNIASGFIHSQNTRVPVAQRIVVAHEVPRGTPLNFFAVSNSSTIGMDARFAFVPVELTRAQAENRAPLQKPMTDSFYRALINGNRSLWNTNPYFNWVTPVSSNQRSSSGYVDVVAFTGVIQRNRLGQPTSVRLEDYAVIRIKLTSSIPQGEKLNVVVNPTFADRNLSNPSGVAGQDVKIASFVVQGLSQEPSSLSQIILKDPSAGTHLGDNFENLIVSHEQGDGFGARVSTLNTSPVQATYTFNFEPTVGTSTFHIAQGESVVFNVLARIKQNPANPLTLLAPAIIVDGVVGRGVNTQSDVSNNTDVPLQSAYILENGQLVVSVASGTPVSSQLVMGSVGVPLAQFKLESKFEPITVNKLAFTEAFGNGATSTIKNLKIYTARLGSVPTAQRGSTAQLTTHASSTSFVEFNNLNIVVGSDSPIIVLLKGDVTSYDGGGISGSKALFKLSAYDYDATTAGVQSSVVATGAFSGKPVKGTYLPYGFNNGGLGEYDQVANTMTVYRSRLTAEYAPDSPSGVVAKSSEQVVAKINVTNAVNSGAYDAVLKVMDLSFSHTRFDASKPRVVRVYKDSMVDSNLIATSSVRLSDGRTNFGTTGVISNLTLSSGGRRTLVVTMDTSDAPSGGVLAVSVPQEFIVWSDGVTPVIKKVDTLPLAPKALSY